MEDRLGRFLSLEEEEGLADNGLAMLSLTWSFPIFNLLLTPDTGLLSRS